MPRRAPPSRSLQSVSYTVHHHSRGLSRGPSTLSNVGHCLLCLWVSLVLSSLSRTAGGRAHGDAQLPLPAWTCPATVGGIERLPPLARPSLTALCLHHAPLEPARLATLPDLPRGCVIAPFVPAATGPSSTD